MKYAIGTIVVLKNGMTIYITDYDEESCKYKGFDTNGNNPKKIIIFDANDVLIKI